MYIRKSSEYLISFNSYLRNKLLNKERNDISWSVKDTSWKNRNRTITLYSFIKLKTSTLEKRSSLHGNKQNERKQSERWKITRGQNHTREKETMRIWGLWSLIKRTTKTKIKFMMKRSGFAIPFFLPFHNFTSLQQGIQNRVIFITGTTQIRLMETFVGTINIRSILFINKNWKTRDLTNAVK